MPTATKLNLKQKLVKVRESCPFLIKDDTNKFSKYDFVSGANALSHLVPEMNTQRVLLVPRIISHEVSDHATKNSGHEYFTELVIEYTWMDADSDETIICPWYGQGLSTNEVGVGKALSYAEKYFFLKFFNVPMDDLDPDNNGNDNRKGSGKQKQNNNQSQSQPQPQNNNPPPDSPYRSDAQSKMMFAILKKNNIAADDMKGIMSLILGKEVTSSKTILKADARKLLDIMNDDTKLSKYLTIKTDDAKHTTKQRLCGDITKARTTVGIDGKGFIQLSQKITGKTTVNLEQFTMDDLHKIKDTLDDPSTLERLMSEIEGIDFSQSKSIVIPDSDPPFQTTTN